MLSRNLLEKCSLSLTPIAALLLFSSCNKSTDRNSTSPLSSVSSSTSGYDMSLFCHDWYYQGHDSPSFTLYSDGTCDISGTYGTGTWAIVNSNILKVTDYYGSSWTKEIFSVSDTELVLGFSDENQEIYWSSEDLSVQAGAEADAEAARLAEEEKLNAPLEITSYDDFKDDLAWITYTQQGNSFLACIDQSGNARFQFEGYYPQVSPFSYDYARITTSDTLYIIDKNGDCHLSFPLSGDTRCVCYGYGYFLEEKHSSGFDSSSYTYTLYHGDGSVEMQFSTQDPITEPYYCGQGVFELPGAEAMYYCVNSHSWHNIGTYPRPTFYDEGLSLVETLNLETDYMLHTCGFSVMDSSGNSRDVYVDSIFWNISPSELRDNICLIYGNNASAEESLISYDLTDDSIYKLDDTYFSKLNLSDADFSKTSSTGAKLLTVPMQDSLSILPLRGDDGNLYSAVFSKDWTLVYGPTTADVSFSGDLLQITENGVVSFYDENGNFVYSPADKGYTITSSYYDGSVLAKDAEQNTVYLDESGNPLFSEITLADVPTKALS